MTILGLETIKLFERTVSGNISLFEGRLHLPFDNTISEREESA